MLHQIVGNANSDFIVTIKFHRALISHLELLQIVILTTLVHRSVFAFALNLATTCLLFASSEIFANESVYFEVDLLSLIDLPSLYQLRLLLPNGCS